MWFQVFSRPRNDSHGPFKFRSKHDTEQEATENMRKLQNKEPDSVFMVVEFYSDPDKLPGKYYVQ